MGRAARTRRRARRRKLVVDLGDRSYPVWIGSGWLDEVGAEVARSTGARRVGLVTVPPVARRYAARVTRSLEAAGLSVARFVVPDGDATKNLKQVADLYEGFLAKGLDRRSAVVTLGGGVVGDLGGFAAATFLRGIPFVQVPTSLLAMVDASIGGKTGVNLPAGKNLVGAFHQPRAVCIDSETLQSLSPRERSAGMAELIKHAAIWDAELFRWLETHVDAVMALEPAATVRALARSCAIKAEVVARDEREGGLRMLLNFGHTVAHAIEALEGFQGILHGEAVAIGMVFAAKRSEEIGHAPAGTAQRVGRLLARAGLPTALPGHARRAYLSALQVDKKKVEKKIHYVVLDGIGRARTVPMTPSEIFPAGWKHPVIDDDVA